MAPAKVLVSFMEGFPRAPRVAIGEPELLRQVMRARHQTLDPQTHRRHKAAPPNQKTIQKTMAPGATGSAKRNTAPPPGMFSAQMRPPCVVIIDRAIDRPRPMPSDLVVKNVSNNCGMS